jgi:hypothetical protein
MAPMSAFGHERTFRSAIAMSALPSKSDIVGDAGQTSSWLPKARHQSKSHSFSIIRTPSALSSRRFFQCAIFAALGRNHAIGGYNADGSFSMYALPAKADIRSAKTNVRFVAHSCSAANSPII